ncbi:MAG: hypothetical protein U1E76_05775 [Planctomycetota bacterium]
MIHALVLTLALQDPAPAAARVILKDGRALAGEVTDTAAGIQLKLKNGTIHLLDDLVENVIYAETEKYAPKDAFEKEQLAKGFVFFRGKWMTKGRMEDTLKKERDADDRRTSDFLSHVDWKNAYTRETKHFQFRANCPPELLDRYASLLEEYFSVFTKAWGISPKLKDKPRVSVYRDARDFKNISGAPLGVVGWFSPINCELNVYWDDSDPDMAFDVLFHEGNHLLTHMMEPGFSHPHWLNEAMAEYYGASEFRDGKVSVGAVQEGRLVEIQQDMSENHMHGLIDLIRAPHDYRAYTWGWSFIHFMMSSPKYEKKIKAFFLGLARAEGLSRTTSSFGVVMKTVEPEVQIDYLRKVVGVDLAQLEQEWHAYVKEKLKLVSGRGYFLAAQRARREGKTEQAAAFVHKAIELGDQRGATWALKGKIHQDNDEQDKAIEAYLKAIELAPVTAVFYYELGEILAQSRDAARQAEGKRYQALAEEIDPSSPWVRTSLRKLLQGG